MSTKLEPILVEQLEEGDVIMLDGQPSLIEDLYENSQMSGIWVCTSTGYDRFYAYDDRVEKVVVDL